MTLRFTTVLTAVALAACGDGAGTAYAQSDPSLSGGPITPEQASYDVTFYDLELNIDPTERSIDGALTVYIDVVQSMEYLVLDLDTTFAVHGAELLGGASPQALACHPDAFIAAFVPLPRHDDVSVSQVYTLQID